MIKAIRLINCKPYVQADLSECQKINFMYGANGSGKSTISSYLAGSSDTRFRECSIEWENENHETIYVYNRGFRTSNFQQTIPGVFTMGNATIEDVNELERLKRELSGKKDEWGRQNESLKKIIAEKKKREEVFKETVWKEILQKNEDQFQKAFEGLRGSKEKFRDELLKRIKEGKGKVCSKEELLQRAQTLYASKPKKVERIKLDIEESIERIEGIRQHPIWSTVIAGNKDVDIAALINELKISSWVSQGRHYITKDTTKCPFCQQETITDEFRIKLDSFFDTEYEKKITLMKTLLSEYKEQINHIMAVIDFAVSNDGAETGKLDIAVYYERQEILRKAAEENVRRIEEKIREAGIKIELESLAAETKSIIDLVETANSAINVHNELVSKIDTAEADLTDDVWATCINIAGPFIKSYNQDIVNIQKGITGIGKQVDSKKEEITQLEAKVIEKGKNITSVQPTIDEINRSLVAYGFTNFSIQPAEDQENYYCIKRDDGTLATGTLSEGEETFLTFLYFMQWAKGSKDPNHVADKKILVLDDPISSLDSTVLYIVGAMVKDLWKKVRDGEGDVNQLFILTHNVFFHKEASFDPRHSLGNNINFAVITKNDGVSEIRNYQQTNPISTSYELLWAEIRENDHISRVSIQNAMRRIIENYFGMLGNEKDDRLIQTFDTAEDQMIARSLLYWINDGSHSIPDDLHIDSYTDAVPKYKRIFREIFEKSNHLAHYNMMMKIEDPPEEIPAETS